MSLSFPPAPTNGQQYQNWVWNSTVGAWLPNYQNVVGSFNGRGGAVTFQPTDNTGGNRVLLNVQTVTTSAPVPTINFFYDFTSKLYDLVEVDVFDVNATAEGSLGLRFSNDGSTWDAGAQNYVYALAYTNATTNSGGSQGAAIAYAHCGGVGAGTTSAGVSRVTIALPGFSDRAKSWLFQNVYYSTSTPATYWFGGGGLYNVVAPIKGIQALAPGGGNFTRAVFAVYGLTKVGNAQ